MYTGSNQLSETVSALEHNFGVIPTAACLMVLQEVDEWRQQLESQLHAIILREIALVRTHHALRKKMATEKQQHANTVHQLTGVKQSNLQVVDELKVKLLGLLPDFLAALCPQRLL